MAAERDVSRWTVILTVLAVLAMIACQTLQPLPPAVTPAPITTPSVIPASTTSPVASAAIPPTWKEFSNDKYSFAFRCPESCGASELDGSFHVGGRIELAILDSEGLSLDDYVNRFLNVYKLLAFGSATQT